MLVKPTKPSFTDGTTITVPTITGVTYRRTDTGAAMTTGTPMVLAAGQSLKVTAEPTTPAHYFADNVNDEWTFKNTTAP